MRHPSNKIFDEIRMHSGKALVHEKKKLRIRLRFECLKTPPGISTGLRWSTCPRSFHTRRSISLTPCSLCCWVGAMSGPTTGKAIPRSAKTPRMRVNILENSGNSSKLKGAPKVITPLTFSAIWPRLTALPTSGLLGLCGSERITPAAYFSATSPPQKSGP